MDSVLERVANELRRRGVTGTRVLVAVSGGIDSTALLRAVAASRETLALELVVGNFNHRYRGAQADADATWVVALAERLGIQSVVGVAQRAAFSSEEAIPEEAARAERYAFLESAAMEGNCSGILMAHTADDQTETVLHHLFRGTGFAGLQGIPAERTLSNGVRIVRPLLPTPRSELEVYLSLLGQDYRTDPTNTDERSTRNWLRHTALPMLRDRFPQLDHSLKQLARQANEVADLLTIQANTLLQKARLDDHADGVRLRASAFVGQPRPVIRALFVQLWKDHHWPRQAMSFERWDELADLALSAAGTHMFPGTIEARRRDDLMVLRKLRHE